MSRTTTSVSARASSRRCTKAIKNSRDLIILFTADYEASPYTRKEFTSFEARDGAKPRGAAHHHPALRGRAVAGTARRHTSIRTSWASRTPEERKRRIIAAAERQSQAAPPPPRPFIGVPPRIASFTGRADELDRLDAILMQDKPAAVTQASVGRAAVQGMGGVGKTSLAVEYAHRYRRSLCGRVLVSSRDAHGALECSCEPCGDAWVQQRQKKLMLRRRRRLRCADWQNNARLGCSSTTTSPRRMQIADLLPSAGARVLITSRFSDWSEVADEVALDVLPLEEAVALLQSRTGRSDAAGATALAEALGRLPLALDHAAAYCKRTQMRFADYAEKASSLIDRCTAWRRAIPGASPRPSTSPSPRPWRSAQRRKRSWRISPSARPSASQ